jgi:hypothetical protein
MFKVFLMCMNIQRFERNGKGIFFEQRLRQKMQRCKNGKGGKGGGEITPKIVFSPPKLAYPY